MILPPIIDDIVRSSRNPDRVIWLYIAIDTVIGLGATIIVYKKILLKVPTAKKSVKE